MHVSEVWNSQYMSKANLVWDKNNLAGKTKKILMAS